MDFGKTGNIIYFAVSCALIVFLFVTLFVVMAKGKRVCSVADIAYRLVTSIVLVFSAVLLVCAIFVGLTGVPRIEVISDSAVLVTDGNSTDLPFGALFTALKDMNGQLLQIVIMLLSIVGLAADCLLANKKLSEAEKKRRADIARIKNMTETGKRDSDKKAKSKKPEPKKASAPKREVKAETSTVNKTVEKEADSNEPLPDWRTEQYKKPEPPTEFVGLKKVDETDPTFDTFGVEEDTAEPATEEQQQNEPERPWYADEAQDAADNVTEEEPSTEQPWYADEAQDAANNATEEEQPTEQPWYADEAEDIADNVTEEEQPTEQPWYADEAEDIADDVTEEDQPTEQPWYADEAQDIADDVTEEEQPTEQPWYADETQDIADDAAEEEQPTEQPWEEPNYEQANGEFETQENISEDIPTDDGEQANRHWRAVDEQMYEEESRAQDERMRYGVEPNRDIYIPQVRTIKRPTTAKPEAKKQNEVKKPIVKTSANTATGKKPIDKKPTDTNKKPTDKKPTAATDKKVAATDKKQTNKKPTAAGKKPVTNKKSNNKKPVAPSKKTAVKTDTKKTPAKKTVPPVNAGKKKTDGTKKQLPVTKRYVILDRTSAVNIFSDYLKERDKEDKDKLKSSINTIIIK